MKRIELLNRIQEIYKKLENDSLNSDEIDELVHLSNKVYERALILRYKVAEQRIFGENVELQTKDFADDTDDLAEVKFEESVLPETIDFSIFEEKEEEILESEAETEKEIIESSTSVSDSSENILNFNEPAVSIEKEDETPAEKEEEKSEVPEIEQKAITNSSDSDWTLYFGKMLSMHSSGIQKSIDSLAGSFGLNERILYINELFNGDAEKFSNAILQLDKIEEWNACTLAMATMAVEENWDKESDTVGEFVLHVNRKHA